MKEAADYWSTVRQAGRLSTFYLEHPAIHGTFWLPDGAQFRMGNEEAYEVRRRADRFGTIRSGFIRESLRRHLAWLSSVEDAGLWEKQPLAADEMAIDQIADWGVAEDRSDWVDAAAR